MEESVSGCFFWTLCISVSWKTWCACV